MVTFMKNRLYIKSYIRNPKPTFDMSLYNPWDFFTKSGVLFSNLFKIVSRADSKYVFGGMLAIW